MTTGNPGDSGHEGVDRAARIIADALVQAESLMAAQRADAQAGANKDVVDALDRFGEVMTRLVEHTEMLARRMAELGEVVAALAEQRATEPAAKPQLPELERSFAPGGEGIDVTIAGVPGFQGLMELQRALVRLPEVQSAAVRRYQDDEAAIQLILSQPMTSSAIAEGVSAGTGKRIIVDESQPDHLRLRLRFLA